MKFISSCIFLFTMVTCTRAQSIGFGTTSPNANAALEVSSTSKGLLLPRLALASTTSPSPLGAHVAGMMVYNTAVTGDVAVGIYVDNGNRWAPITIIANYPTSGGTALVSAYSCSTASDGNMTHGVAVSGVTQTITATVATAGTYNITASSNGVTYTGSGVFSGTGARDIVLTAAGTPTAAATSSFALGTTPGCSFSRTVN